MKLHHDTFGPESGLPVLLVHGLYGQGRNLGAQARRLAENRRVITVDLRNHGDSPHDADASYAALAGDLAEMIEGLGGRVDLVGHSMGGKAAMVLALTHPDMVRRLAIMDISPVAYDHDQTRFVDAMQGLDLTQVTRRSQANAMLADIVRDNGTRAFLLQNLDLKSDPHGWRLNLDALRQYMPQIVGWPDGLPTASFGGKTLALRGALSDYVTETGENALREYFPQARIVTLKNTGHWLHAEQPEAVAETLVAFFGDGNGD
jgi:pimeloyl-ACP methyl ester carboxylesterase